MPAVLALQPPAASARWCAKVWAAARLADRDAAAPGARLLVFCEPVCAGQWPGLRRVKLMLAAAGYGGRGFAGVAASWLGDGH